jgi:methylated-DNA-[protein]-cysteine S-methyltransferase
MYADDASSPLLRPRRGHVSAPAVTVYDQMASPIGWLLLAGDARRLMVCRYSEEGDAPPGARRDRRALAGARRQLEEYFAGGRVAFDLALAPSGTDFQRRVWAALSTIGYAKTASYGEIAAAIGRPRASRAVGAANRVNPIAIIIPCHRVIGADGTLTGYAGGLSRKAALLELEAARLARGPSLAAAAANSMMRT